MSRPFKIANHRRLWDPTTDTKRQSRNSHHLDALQRLAALDFCRRRRVTTATASVVIWTVQVNPDAIHSIRHHSLRHPSHQRRKSRDAGTSLRRRPLRLFDPKTAPFLDSTTSKDSATSHCTDKLAASLRSVNAKFPCPTGSAKTIPMSCKWH